jgi:hypothetical protein
MKRESEYIKGPEAWTRFHTAMQKVVTLPHAELQRRIEAERATSALNPNRRGPKPKRKHASPIPAE